MQQGPIWIIILLKQKPTLEWHLLFLHVNVGEAEQKLLHSLDQGGFLKNSALYPSKQNNEVTNIDMHMAYVHRG